MNLEYMKVSIFELYYRRKLQNHNMLIFFRRSCMYVCMCVLVCVHACACVCVRVRASVCLSVCYLYLAVSISDKDTDFQVVICQELDAAFQALDFTPGAVGNFWTLEDN